MAPETKAKLFQCRSMEDVCIFLAALEPPLQVSLPPAEHDSIKYPKKLEEMSGKERRKIERAQEKVARKQAKKARKDVDLDSMDDLVAG